jgi:parvulin-like peptidyl-prolyl isomerase
MHMQATKATFIMAAALLAARGIAAQEADRVVARVNDTPIRESALLTGIPKDAFANRVARIKETKLERLIETIAQRDFLKAQGITVSPAEVDKAIEELRKNPPEQGCACHRYDSLDAYLTDNYYTPAELREETRIQLGIGKYVLRLWDKDYPTPAARRTLAASERKRLERDYARLWHIFFSTILPPKGTAPEQAEPRARQLADKAWKRLQKGDAFATVAREMSDDEVSGPKGGALGLIDRATFGRDFAATVNKLKPGALSKPFKTAFGYHIVKWAPIEDDELIQINKTDYLQRKTEEVLDQIRSQAKVVRL